MKRIGKFVFPGEKLGVIEEFFPGSGTYVDAGEIYSLTTGYSSLNRTNRMVSVYSIVRKHLIPQKRDIVIGSVSSIQEKNLSVKIFQINNRFINNSFTGVMHIADVSRRYVKTMFDIYKADDIIRAKVISTLNREYHLTTNGKDLGVLRALCSHCGSKLVLKNTKLKCQTCNNIERRKLTSDYNLLF